MNMNGAKRKVGRAVFLAISLLALWSWPMISSAQTTPLLRSARSGPWSAPGTWEGGKVPPPASRVQIRQGHTVVYDLKSDQAIRSIHVAGTLTFASDRDTQLNVGLIKIQPGDDASEDGFDCDAHVPELKPGQERPALLVGTPEQPIAAKHSALIPWFTLQAWTSNPARPL